MSEFGTDLQEKQIFYLFEGSLFLKGVHAVIEIIGGILTLFITQNFLINAVLDITHKELAEDPHDFLVNYLLHSANNFSISSKYFIAFYLLSHGVIKGILVILLYAKKLWAYPVSIFVFGLFMIYQIQRYTRTHSVWLIAFTIFDAFVIWLIWHEYKLQKSKSGLVSLKSS